MFHLLGYQFSPRIADVGGARFWRVHPKADYGVLDGLAANRINLRLVAEQWDDLLRLAGSLKLGVVRAAGLTRTLQTNDRPTRLARARPRARAPGEDPLPGSRYVDDEAYRRRILTQLNRHEGRHRLARTVFHGPSAASSGSATARDRRTSSEASASSSTSWCYGTRSP